MDRAHHMPNVIGNEEDFKDPEDDGFDTLGVSAAEINAKAPNVAALFELCENSGFAMPSAAMGINSRQFLADVLTKQCFSFKNEDLRHKTVYGNPKTVSEPLLPGASWRGQDLCAFLGPPRRSPL